MLHHENFGETRTWKMCQRLLASCIIGVGEVDLQAVTFGILVLTRSSTAPRSCRKSWKLQGCVLEQGSDPHGKQGGLKPSTKAGAEESLRGTFRVLDC